MATHSSILAWEIPWTEEHLLLFVSVVNMLNALGTLLILNTQNSMRYIPLLCQFGDKESVQHRAYFIILLSICPYSVPPKPNICARVSGKTHTINCVILGKFYTSLRFNFSFPKGIY